MGIYYYAVDVGSKKYFSAPGSYAIESPGIYHPQNPFAHMMVMMNVRGSHFELWDDCSKDVPPDDDYQEITNEVYDEYLNTFVEV